MKKFSEVLKTNEDYARLLLESEDYRAFLKCYFSIKKAFNPTYSYAVFARHAEVAKSLPRDICEGLKRLTDKTLPQFLKAMELEGLLEEYFVQLVAAEADSSKLKLVKRLKDLYLETNFTQTFTDNNFQDHRSPFLYAASGEVDKGVSLEVLSRRTGMSLAEVKASLPRLEELKLGRYNPDQDSFIPATSHVHVTPGQQQRHFVDFYLHCLDLQKENVQAKFSSEEALFYNEVFSVSQKDLPRLKAELKKTLKSFILNAENPQGDSVAVLNLGLFQQRFKPSPVQTKSSISQELQ